MAGITDNGFTRKLLSDIKTDVENRLIAVFGPINSEPDSVFGQIIGVLSEAISEVWEAVEDSYYAMYPSSAEGFSLDGVVDLVGIRRLEATKSTVTAIIEGTEGTVVPAGTQFRQQTTNELFESDVAVTITKGVMGSVQPLGKAVVSVNTIPGPGGESYNIELNGDFINYFGPNGQTILDVLNGIAAEFSSTDWDAVVDTTAETITITPNDSGRTPFAIDVTSNMDLDEIWADIALSALVTGAIEVPINSIINIETPVSGLNEVDNLYQGTAGRETETDTALRIRRATSLNVSGAASIPAMEARLLQEVDDVLSVTIIDNRTDVTDGEGRPPHSFEALVTGGDDQDILDKLWEIKPAGIATYGNVSGTVVDSHGVSQTLYFSRPTEVPITVVVNFDEDTEEALPSNYSDLIKAAIVAFSLTEQSVGKDITIQRYLRAIYEIDGVGVVTVLTMDDGGGTVSDLIEIASGDIATFDATNITVTKN